MPFFDDSHVTDVGLEGSAGPPTGFGEMFSQSLRQQFRVDSARALDTELESRWLESLRAAQINLGPVKDMWAYRAFAQHVSGQPIDVPDPNRNTYGDYDMTALNRLTGPYDPTARIKDLIEANEKIKQLGNPNIKTFEQIVAEVAQMQQEVEEDTSSMYERTGTGGFIASLLGSAVGSFSLRDPANIITAPVGAGRTIATRIASEMALAAGIVGYTELAEVAPARQIVGLPERDPLFNIAAAAVGAGAIRGGIEGVGYGIRRYTGGIEDIDFDARDAQLAQMFAANSEKPSARAGAMILDDATFIERNNPFGESRAAQERFIAELTEVQKAMNGAPMTAVGRVMPPLPFEYIKKAADFEIVREQAPDVWAKMEVAQAKVARPPLYHGTDKSFETFQPSQSGALGPGIYLSAKQDYAEQYSKIRLNERVEGESVYRPGAKVLEVDAEIKNPYVVSEEEFISKSGEEINQRARSLGHDSIVYHRIGTNAPDAPFYEVVVFDPTQIKSITDVNKARRAANAEYQSAYRAVEAEAARLNTLATKAQAAQQAEGANILAQAYGRPFIGPLLRHNNVEALVERINKINDTLDEDTIALFARQAEGEGKTAPRTKTTFTTTKNPARSDYTRHSFVTLTEEGQQIRGQFRTFKDSDVAFIDGVTSLEGPMSFGPAIIKEIAADLRREFPHINKVRGVRGTGARKAAVTADKNLEIDISKIAPSAPREVADEVAPEAWRTEDGRVDIGLRDPVDPNFTFVTDEGEMTVAAAMRDLQDDTDLVEAIRVCSI